MSATLTSPAAVSSAFESVMADLKSGVASATAAQAEASRHAVNAAKTLAEFNKGTLEAFTQSTQLFAEGSKDLLRQIAESNKAAYTAAFSGLRSLAAAKTIKERIALQASLTQAAAGRAVSESSRFAQSSLALAEKVAAPITARALLAAESFASLKA